MKEIYLTSSEVAERFRVKTSTLANWRTQDREPRYVKVGGRVLYRKSDLEGFVQHSTTQSDGSAGDPPDKTEFDAFVASLPRRAQTALRFAGVASLEQLAHLDERELRRLPNCGERTMEQIRAAGRRHLASKTKSASRTLDHQVAQLVDSYGLKHVFSSVAKLLPK